MNFPEHICLSLRHNPHRGDYTPVETWLENYLLSAEAGGEPRDEAILPEDRGAILATGEVWELSWCPRTPVGSCSAVAATMERVLELAGVGTLTVEAAKLIVQARDTEFPMSVASIRVMADKLEADERRIAELEVALDRLGDYSRHHDEIRRVLGRRP
jgi:hypothetical protein